MSDNRRDCKPAPYHKITFSRTLATWVRSKLVGDQDWTGPGAQPERQQRWRAGSRDAIQTARAPWFQPSQPLSEAGNFFWWHPFGQKKDIQANAIMLTTKGVKIPTISNLSFHICFLLVLLHALNGSSANGLPFKDREGPHRRMWLWLKYEDTNMFILYVNSNQGLTKLLAGS